MASHVPIVAILMIVQGVLEILMGLLLGLLGPMLLAFIARAEQQGQGQPPPPGFREMFDILAIVYAVLGGICFVAGVLKIIAGIRNYKYRGYALGIVGLISGVGAMISFYCAPTALALLIYGLIVYLNPETKRAFALGACGLSPEAIKDELRRPPEDDDRAGYELGREFDDPPRY
jgi:hypothetical protein